MDAYLESLVKKDEVVETVETVEKVAEVAEPIEEAAEAAVAEPVAEQETVGEQETVEEAIVRETSCENGDPAVVVTEPVVEKSKTEKATTDHKEGDLITVEHIKVYKSPDINQIAKTISGNIKYAGKIGDFNIIWYMKHGFGLVKGYTLDDLS